MQALWSTPGPISNAGGTFVFSAAGTWTVNVAGSPPLAITPTGSMTVSFTPDTTPGILRAIVQAFTLSLPGLFESSLLPLDGPDVFIEVEDLITGEFEPIHASSFFLVDADTGETSGALGTVNVSPDSGTSQSVAVIAGGLNFAAGSWAWTADLPVCPIPEPPTSLLLGVGLIALGSLRFRRRNTR